MYIPLLLIACFFKGLVGSLSFSPPPTFSGDIGPYKLKHVEKPIASHFFKHQQIKTIVEDMDTSKAVEFGEAKRWCREHRTDENYLATAIEFDNVAEYLILYRQHPRRIVTIEAIVRNLDADSLTTEQLMIMLRKQSLNNYLQIHDLKRWANGRYHMEMKLEKMFETF